MVHSKVVVALILIIAVVAIGIYFSTQKPISPTTSPRPITQIPDDPQALIKFIDETENQDQRLQATDKLLSRVSGNQKQDIITSLIIHPDPAVATRAIRSIQTSTQANSSFITQRKSSV